VHTVSSLYVFVLNIYRGYPLGACHWQREMRVWIFGAGRSHSRRPCTDSDHSKRPICRRIYVIGPIAYADEPKRTPRSFARLRPSPVRARISSRSNSAKPPNTVNISRPCGLVVSAQVSFSERKPAPRFVMASMTLSRSRVERASLSTSSTRSASPVSSWTNGRREACRNSNLIASAPHLLTTSHYTQSRSSRC